jgi:hypothetical protein
MVLLNYLREGQSMHPMRKEREQLQKMHLRRATPAWVRENRHLPLMNRMREIFFFAGFARPAV